MKNKFEVGSKIQLFPADTYKKIAIILEINKFGHVFQICETETKEYTNGDILFVSHSMPLKMKLL